MRLFVFPRAADLIRISQVICLSTCQLQNATSLVSSYHAHMAWIWLCLFGVRVLDPVDDMLISTPNSQYFFMY